MELAYTSCAIIWGDVGLGLYPRGISLGLATSITWILPLMRGLGAQWN